MHDVTPRGKLTIGSKFIRFHTGLVIDPDAIQTLYAVAYTHPRVIDGQRLEAGLKLETKYSEHSIPLGSKAEAQQMANTIMQLANERDIVVRQAVARNDREQSRPVANASDTAHVERKAAAQ
jgi:hypothetical protein